MKSFLAACCLLLISISHAHAHAHAHAGEHDGPCVELATMGASSFAPLLRSGIPLEEMMRLIDQSAPGNRALKALATQLARRPDQSDGDAYRLVFVTCMKSSGVSAPETSPLYQWITRPEDTDISLGNGIRLPYGQALATFQTNHPEGQCFDYQGKKLCEYQAPSADICVGARDCRELRFLFKEEKLVGFVASYARGDWQSLFDVTERIYGKPNFRNTPATAELPMGSETYKWALKLGVLTFVHFNGSDINGEAVGQPYLISFGPDSFQ